MLKMSRVRIRNTAALVFITSLVIVFSFFQDTQPQDLLKAKSSAQPTVKKQYPRNIIEQSTVRQFDENGQLLYVFVSDEMRSFQKNPKRPNKKDFTELFAPDMTLYNEDKAPWRITAKKGKAFDNGSYVILKNKVLAWQDSPERGHAELATPSLVLKPEVRYAETDKAVKLSSQGHRVTANGMIADLKHDKIKLLSKVRGIHEPL